VDVLTVRVGDAVAEARTEVSYVPGLEIKGPDELIFVPPAVIANFYIKNVGNGEDEVYLKLLKGEDIISSRRISLKPGAFQNVHFSIVSPGSYKLEVRLFKGKLERTWRFYVRMPRNINWREHRIWGTTSVVTESGTIASARLDLTGRLSDFVGTQFSIGGGYTGLSDLRFQLNGDHWFVNTMFVGTFSANAAYRHGPVGFSVNYYNTNSFGVGLSYKTKTQHHNFWLSWKGAPVYYASGHSALGFGIKSTYGLSYVPIDGQGTVYLRLDKSPLAAWVELNTSAEWEAGIDIRKYPIDFGLSVSWQKSDLKNWYSSVLWRIQQDIYYWRPVVGVWVSNENYGFALAALREGSRFNITANGSWVGEWSVDAGLFFSLPNPFTDANVRYTYSKGQQSWLASLGLEASWEGLHYSSDAWLTIPLTDSGLSLSLETGSGTWSLGGELEFYPWRVDARGEFWIDFYVWNSLIEAKVYGNYPEGEWGWRVGFVQPLVFSVPKPVVELFGGRKIALVKGQLVYDGPSLDLSGIRVVAGPYEAVTNEAGEFKLELPPGEYFVTVDPTTLPVILAMRDNGIKLKVEAKRTYSVELRLEARSALEGVILAKGEAPQSLALWVWIEDEKGRRVYVRADRLGRFIIGGLVPGYYRAGILKSSLPWGYRVEPEYVEVQLEPGEIKKVRFLLSPLPRKVYKAKPVIILSAKPESGIFPPGALPLIEVEIEGEPEKLLVLRDSEVVGELNPIKGDIWRGRFKVPQNEGRYPLKVVASAGGREVAHYTFVIDVSEKAPWGVIRTRPIVPRGAKDIYILVHLYVLAREAWLVVGDQRYKLKGKGADWKGSYDAPPEPGRYNIKVQAILEDGRRVELSRGILVR